MSITLTVKSKETNKIVVLVQCVCVVREREH